MVKFRIGKASITWKEELVESEDSFYVRLSPNVNYREYSVEKVVKEVGNEALQQIKKGVKGVK